MEIKKEIKNLIEIEYKDLVSLISTIKSGIETEETDEFNAHLFSILLKFFSDFSQSQEFEFFVIINRILEGFNCKEEFDEFKNKYPDVLVHINGDGEKKLKKSWEIRELSLNLLLDSSRSIKSREAYQIYNSFYLTNLANLEMKSSYEILKSVYFRKSNDMELYSQISKMEVLLKELYLEPRKILGKVLLFIKNRQPKNWKIFLKHLYNRIEILNLDFKFEIETGIPMSDMNFEFLENLNSL